MRRAWFTKLIGCAFYLGEDVVRKEDVGEYIYCGTCEHSEHDDKRDSLQYEFYRSDTQSQYLLNYKQARFVMGAMIDFAR